ncbi:MAG: TIGR03769 domain-containing protein, partial [Verrucomicrobiales bacterium]|nr:TIGR03769 domain-containing protein [Verrucomicrobiales bacterium]
DTGDGISTNDLVALGTGGHKHINWAFTAPGYYRVTLEGRGTLVAGNQPVTTRADFFFEVIGASPALALTRSGDGLSLSLNTEEGVHYRLQACAALGAPWQDVGAAFVGTGRGKTITLPKDASAEFFRVLVGN